MIKVHTIFTHNNLRNYTYLLENDHKEFWCIDPWDATKISTFINKQNGTLKSVINTHEHDDHTRGNTQLKKTWGCTIYGLEGIEKYVDVDQTLSDGKMIALSKNSFLKTISTPGHTMFHLCLFLCSHKSVRGVFTGDTLFNAGVGNCHNGGDAKMLYQTIKKNFSSSFYLSTGLSIHDQMKIYPGHDYMENNLNFTLNYQPDNLEAKQMLELVKSRGFDNEKFNTTLGDEKKINLFLKTKTEEEFVNYRRLRDRWNMKE